MKKFMILVLVLITVSVAESGELPVVEYKNYCGYEDLQNEQENQINPDISMATVDDEQRVLVVWQESEVDSFPEDKDHKDRTQEYDILGRFLYYEPIEDSFLEICTFNDEAGSPSSQEHPAVHGNIIVW